MTGALMSCVGAEKSSTGGGLTVRACGGGEAGLDAAGGMDGNPGADTAGGGA